MHKLKKFTAIVGSTITLVLLSAASAAAANVSSVEQRGEAIWWPPFGDTTLIGSEEVPPADPDGSGRFQYFVWGSSLCYRISIQGIDKPTAAHIHHGKAGENGPIVVTLQQPDTGSSRGCIRANRQQNADNAAEVLTLQELQGITEDEWSYYVNVHNAEFPAGAVRGQLG